MNLTLADNNEFINKLTEIIKANLGDESFGGKELSRLSGQSVFVLNRRMKVISKKTINQFIREIRLKTAMELLLNEELNISEISYKVGFNSPAYFNTCFSEYFGYSPGDMKRRALSFMNEKLNIEEQVLITENQEHTQAVTKFKSRKFHKRKSFIFIGSGILFLILLWLIFNNYFVSILNFPKVKHQENFGKSIAVLPFINDSPDSSNIYLINGFMDDILNNLSKVKDLRVVSRNSVEQYRNNKTKTISQIAKELNVNFIVEGSGRTEGNKIKINLHLNEATSDKNLYSETFTRDLEDIFNLQSEIAFLVVSKIKSEISPEEKYLIEKPSTTNLAAWEMYSRGFELHNIAALENKPENDRQAEIFFRKAIQLDSAYSNAYVQIGWIKIGDGELDSAMYYADRALHFDNKNPRPFAMKSQVYLRKGMWEKAEENCLKAIKYNPNYSSAYRFLGNIYLNQGDLYKSIKSQMRTFQLENNTLQARNNLIYLWISLNILGLYVEGNVISEKFIELYGDSTYFYWDRLWSDLVKGNYKSVVNSSRKIYNLDSLNFDKLFVYGNPFFLGNIYLDLKDYGEAFRILDKYKERMKHRGWNIRPNSHIGFIYLKNGKKEEADFHFEESLKESLSTIRQNIPSKSCRSYFPLIYIYSAQGEKTKALENLKTLINCKNIFVSQADITSLKINPILDCIRQEPELKEFLKTAEAKLKEDQEKVLQLLKEENFLEFFQNSFPVNKQQ